MSKKILRRWVKIEAYLKIFNKDSKCTCEHYICHTNLRKKKFLGGNLQNSALFMLDG